MTIVNKTEEGRKDCNRIKRQDIKVVMIILLFFLSNVEIKEYKIYATIIDTILYLYYKFRKVISTVL